MRDFWKTAFTVVVAGFALVATLDVRRAYADDAGPNVINTLCEQGVLTVCGEKTEYTCPQGGGINYTFPYSFGINITQPVCYPTSKKSVYKDFISNTPTIVVTATRPRCTPKPTSGTPDADADDAESSTAEDCTE
jgi:hypothetical protein